MYVCMHFCMYICLHVCMYVRIYPHMCCYICVESNDTDKPHTCLKLYSLATCDIAKRLPKIRVMENGQRNDIECVRIVGMDDT